MAGELIGHRLRSQRDAVEQFARIDDARDPVRSGRKMPLVAGHEIFGARRFRAVQKLRVPRIGEGGAGPFGAASSPRARNIANADAIASGSNANFGRASTSAYSCRIASER